MTREHALEMIDRLFDASMDYQMGYGTSLQTVRDRKEEIINAMTAEAADPALLAAAETVLRHLVARIEEANGARAPVPVFVGIAALDTALKMASDNTVTKGK